MVRSRRAIALPLITTAHRLTVLRRLRLFAAKPGIATKRLKRRRKRAPTRPPQFIRVDPRPSVVDPTRSHIRARQEPRGLEQKSGEFGKAYCHFLIRIICEIRG